MEIAFAVPTPNLPRKPRCEAISPWLCDARLAVRGRSRVRPDLSACRTRSELWPSKHHASVCPGGLGAHPRGEFRTRERP